MKVTVLGAGAWGTALARLLQEGGHAVTLWGHAASHLDELRRDRCNTRYLPGVALSNELLLEADLARAVADAEAIIVAVPSKALRTVTNRLQGYRRIVVSVTKGIEFDSGLTMCGVLAQTMPKAKHAAMSGPTLAMEVARGIPSAIVAASPDESVAQAVQQLFHRPTFRVYTSNDLPGVELGGALKNVVAIAAGVCDGLGFGDNSKAALITRGIAEIRRIGAERSAQPETFAGLSGLGDLTVTCFSKLSRNRAFGERLGRGEPIGSIVTSSISVAEGYPTACSAHQLAQKLKVDAPIIKEVHEMLYNGKDVRRAVRDLTGRESKPEME